ncbi:hypothetical protein KC909_02720, partial [Candidatus Dojkabacteria bacterium]|nr:hypothetical protein [Candidatus Dojkabacteria bacterium]
TANVNIKVGTSIDENFMIPPGEAVLPKWGVVDGPVIITSDIDVYSTKRTLINGSFNEIIGL